MQEEYLIRPKHFSARFIHIFQTQWPLQPTTRRVTVVVSGAQSGPSVKFFAYLKLEGRLRNSGTTTTILPRAPPWRDRRQINFYIRIYIHIYSSSWYDCKLRHDSKLPITGAFSKIACRLSPTSLFRTLKFLTDYSTHLRKANYFCSTLVHRPQNSGVFDHI